MEAIIDSELDFSGILQGIVIKRNDEKLEGRVGVFIPKLMFAQEEINLDAEESSKEFPAYDSKVDNKENKILSTFPIESINYIWARPLNKFSQDSKNGNISGEQDIPQLGEKIPIVFIDNDPQKCYYFNNSITMNGEKLAIKNLPHSESSKKDKDKRPNIKVLFEAPNGNIIAMDYNESVNSFVVSINKSHKIIMVDNASASEIRIEDKNKNSITIDSKKDTITINTEKDLIVNSKGETVINASNITLKTPDSSTWLPNVIPVCPFTGAPHGGPGAGITKLKGA